MCRPLPLTWNFSREGSPCSSSTPSAIDQTTAHVGEGGVALHSNKGHTLHELPTETHWGAILERSFSAHNSLQNIFEGVTDLGVGVADALSSTSTSVSCPHGLANQRASQMSDNSLYGTLPRGAVREQRKQRGSRRVGYETSESEGENGILSPF